MNESEESKGMGFARFADPFDSINLFIVLFSINEVHSSRNATLCGDSGCNDGSF